MTWLWLILSFALGWLICWKTSAWLMRKALRTDTYFQAALATMRYERLIVVQQRIEDELAKRREP